MVDEAIPVAAYVFRWAWANEITRWISCESEPDFRQCVLAGGFGKGACGVESLVFSRRLSLK